MKGDPKERNIENTFVPNCGDKMLSVGSLEYMLRQGFVTLDMMPDDVKVRVEKELIKRHPEVLKKHPELIKRHPEWNINSFSDDSLEELK
jgi:hypothetical protein